MNFFKINISRVEVNNKIRGKFILFPALKSYYKGVTFYDYLRHVSVAYNKVVLKLRSIKVQIGKQQESTL